MNATTIAPGAPGSAALVPWVHGLGPLLLVGAGLLVGSWAVLIILARRLPAGAAKDLASVLPSCVTTARRLWRDPRVPRRAKVAVGVAALWVLSPIDLIPEFVPVIGPLDDVIVVAIALRYAARTIPRDVLDAAWPGEPHVLGRLLGQAPPSRRRETRSAGGDSVRLATMLATAIVVGLAVCLLFLFLGHVHLG